MAQTVAVRQDRKSDKKHGHAHTPARRATVPARTGAAASVPAVARPAMARDRAEALARLRTTYGDDVASAAESIEEERSRMTTASVASAYRMGAALTEVYQAHSDRCVHDLAAYVGLGRSTAYAFMQIATRFQGEEGLQQLLQTNAPLTIVQMALSLPSTPALLNLLSRAGQLDMSVREFRVELAELQGGEPAQHGAREGRAPRAVVDPVRRIAAFAKHVASLDRWVDANPINMAPAAVVETFEDDERLAAFVATLAARKAEAAALRERLDGEVAALEALIAGLEGQSVAAPASPAEPAAPLTVVADDDEEDDADQEGIADLPDEGEPPAPAPRFSRPFRPFKS